VPEADLPNIHEQWSTVNVIKGTVARDFPSPFFPSKVLYHWTLIHILRFFKFGFKFVEFLKLKGLHHAAGSQISPLHYAVGSQIMPLHFAAGVKSLRYIVQQ
jgi:hypothetical protein